MFLGQGTRWTEDRRGLVRTVSRQGVRGHSGPMTKRESMGGELPRPMHGVAGLRGLEDYRGAIFSPSPHPCGE